MNIWKGKVLSEVPFGHVLVVSGKIKPNPNKICLDLTEECNVNNETGIVLLHIEANFSENQIIRSMYQPGNGWSQEEISKNWTGSSTKNPLVPGDNFTFRVAVLQKCYEIYVNDKLYGTFEHLHCPKKINFVLLKGDFEKILQFHHRMLFPLVFPKNLLSCDKVCFQSDVPKKYESGTAVIVEGIATGPSTTNFSICFLCNDTRRIFLQFLVDFGNKLVIRNFQRDDNMFHSSDEEHNGDFPFKRGKLFKIAFGLNEKYFLIAVNGKYYCYFNFPFKSFAISTLKCFCHESGDLTVTNLEYHADAPLLSRIEKLSIL